MYVEGNKGQRECRRQRLKNKCGPDPQGQAASADFHLSERLTSVPLLLAFLLKLVLFFFLLEAFREFCGQEGSRLNSEAGSAHISMQNHVEEDSSACC